MRTLCDVCESAAAKLFCAADEAALCLKCDEKVHGCNKLANRHVRLQMTDPRPASKCDVCENAPAFFYCGVDGTSLCLQCDLDVHKGGKKTHERYVMFGQKVELRDDSCGGNDQQLIRNACQPLKRVAVAKSNNTDAPAVAIAVGDADAQSGGDQEYEVSHMIDLNSRPLHLHLQGQAAAANTTNKSTGSLSSDDDCPGVVPEITSSMS